MGSTMDSYKQRAKEGYEGPFLSNLEFIATYIFNNPGARRKDIVRELMIYKWGHVPTDIVVRGWGSSYFTGARYSPSPGDRRFRWSRYGGRLWKLVDIKKPTSGYLLTEDGLKYVVLDRSL